MNCPEGEWRHAKNRNTLHFQVCFWCVLCLCVCVVCPVWVLCVCVCVCTCIGINDLDCIKIVYSISFIAFHAYIKL